MTKFTNQKRIYSSDLQSLINQTRVNKITPYAFLIKFVSSSEFYDIK